MKTCTECKEIKDLLDFYPDPRMRDKRMSRCKACNAQRTRNWELANPQRSRERKRRDWIKRTWNMTEQEYDSFRSQACEICGDIHDMVIDHDHLSGKIRGVLCKKCNNVLGMARDKPNILRAAASYLERSEQIRDVNGTET
jgi:hypothetical protein